MQMSLYGINHYILCCIPRETQETQKGQALTCPSRVMKRGEYVKTVARFKRVWCTLAYFSGFLPDILYIRRFQFCQPPPQSLRPS